MKAPAVLFVCLGNICRSPLAEAAFRMEATRLNLRVEIDSAGTGNWHTGSAPDHRAQAIARKMGCDISGLKARQFEASDFQHFTHIFAMDRQNLQDLQAIAPLGTKGQLSLLLDLIENRKGQNVADPYYGNERDFEQTWRDVHAAAKMLAAAIQGR